MNDLVEQVAQKAGITPDQARTAVELVRDYLKGKLPGPAAEQLDGALGTDGGRSMGDAIKHLRAAMGGS